MNAAEVLVIILSIFLAVFLIVGIILVVLLIRVTLQIRRVTSKAEKAADGVEQFVGGASAAASKAVLGKLIITTLKKAYAKKKGGAK
jgi:hypothetical protein